MDPQKTAVVLVEYQNDFTSEGGALHGAVKDSMAATDMLTHTQEAVAAARAAGATIIHAPIQFAAGYGEITSHPTASSRASSTRTPSSRAPGAPTSSARWRPQPGDIVLEGKRGLDAFASTNLDFILRSKGIETVALGGFLTNCCVESTMRIGVREGLRGRHAHRLRRRDEQRGARERDHLRLPDVLQADDRVGVRREPRRWLRRRHLARVLTAAREADGPHPRRGGVRAVIGVR